MTEQQTPPTDDDTTADTHTGTAEPTTPEEEPAETAGEPGNEAARYRRRLRDVEAERDALSGRVEGMQRAIIEGQAAASLAQPADLWMVGITLPDLLDGDGNVDPSKVDEAVSRVLQERPGWAAPPRTPSFDSGMKLGASASRGPSWQSVIRGG